MEKIKNIFLPDLGEGIDFATISEVSVSVGDSIKRDDIMLVLESDKASMEIPSEIGGVVEEIKVKKDQEVQTGDLLISIKTTEEKESIKEKKLKEEPIQTKRKEPVEKQEKPIKTLAPKADGIYASPGVRRLSRELEINLNTIPGSGEKGRITKDDLHGYIKAKMYTTQNTTTHTSKEIDFNQWGEVDVKKLTKIKKITGQRLSQAWQTIPHVTQFIDSNVTDLEVLRKKQKEKQVESGIKITMMPYLIKALVAALKEQPLFNSSLQANGENIVYKKYYHIGIAVDTKEGLVVPVIRDVDKKNIIDLSKELMDLSDRARKKKLKPNELKGGTFTVSNLGGIGGAYFTPIINPPEVAILGVSRIRKEKNNKEELMLPLSLSYDHRVVDGAAGATFMVLLSKTLNNPQSFI